MTSTQEAVESQCRTIYTEAQAFFERIPRRPDYGFKIFNSPPIYQPPFLFIGYQPGGGAEAATYESNRQGHLVWPSEAEYATATWDLARHMREMFHPTVNLAKCVGSNAIFLRSPSVAEYKKNLHRDVRAEVQQFCAERVHRIVDVLQPLKIVAIGFSTLALFGETIPDIKNSKGRVLTRKGKIGDREVIAMLHLTGAQISKDDRRRIRDAILVD